MRLRREHPDHPVGEATARRYVQVRKRELGHSGREVFVPQCYELGQEAQVDWFEGMARLGGEVVKLQFFAMRSMALAMPSIASNYDLLLAYTREPSKEKPDAGFGTCKHSAVLQSGPATAVHSLKRSSSHILDALLS
jgi:hypothetical protein